MSADEIHNLGLKEVARIRKEMKNVMKEVGFKGSLLEFFEHVRTDKNLMPFDTADQVIENFKLMYEKIKPFVDQQFDLQPKTPFEIRRVEAFREKSAAAHYNRGSLDGSRPGIFYVPIPNVRKYNIFDNEALFLHEAIPGHHFQISIQQENQKLPNFRKNSFYSAFSEGWALYTESLGRELGLYDDPYQYFGMLNMEMHRAIRLVVDTGLHSKGWTREDAIAYSLENEGDSEEKLTSEIERYMANPGQALSYKIGQLKIRELRDLAEEQMGDRFDIKTFHRKVLEDGALPLSILEKKFIFGLNNKIDSMEIINPDLFLFLSKLKRNNNREWFQSNKAEFKKLESEVKSFVKKLKKIFKIMTKSKNQKFSVFIEMFVFRIIKHLIKTILEFLFTERNHISGGGILPSFGARK